MGFYKVIKNADNGADYLYNALKYIKESSIKYGTYMVSYDKTYEHMIAVKKFFGKTNGNHFINFVIHLDDNYIKDYWDEETIVNTCMNMAYMIAKFFGKRYQVCYGLHKTNFYNLKNEYIKTGYHLHMIFNSVSYIDGQMLEISEEDFYAFKEYISLISHYSIEKVNYSENLIEVLV